MKRLALERTEVVFLGLGLLLQVVFLIQFWGTSPFADNLIVDAHRYDHWATTLLENGFRHDHAFHQAPLYPYAVAVVYAIFGGSTLAVFILQGLIGAVIPFLVYRIGRDRFGRTAGIYCAALALGYGPLLAFTPRLLPTVPVIALELLLLDRLPATTETRWRRWILPGIILGVLCITRPNLLLLAAGVALFGLALARIPRKSALAFLVAAAVVILPVTAHNLVHGRALVLVASHGGETFYHGNNPRSVGTYTLMAGLESADIYQQAEISKALAERESGRRLNVSEVQNFWLGKGWDFIRDDPGRYVWLEFQKLRLMLGAEEVPDIYSPVLEKSMGARLLRIVCLSLPWVLPLALAGLVCFRSRLGPWLTGLLIVHAVTLLVFYVSNRYRLPLEALALLPAGAALAGLRQRRVQVTVLIGVVLTAALALSSDPDRAKESRAMVLANLGTSMARAGDHAEAIPIFKRVTDMIPRWARGHHYLGKALAVRGEMESAFASFQMAVTLEPEQPELHIDLARASAALGRGDDAMRTLDHAAALAKDDPARQAEIGSVWTRIGVNRGMSGDAAGARDALQRAVALAPRDPNAWMALARANLDLGDCDAAREVVERGVAASGVRRAVFGEVERLIRERCGEGADR